METGHRPDKGRGGAFRCLRGSEFSASLDFDVKGSDGRPLVAPDAARADGASRPQRRRENAAPRQLELSVGRERRFWRLDAGPYLPRAGVRDPVCNPLHSDPDETRTR